MPNKDELKESLANCQRANRELAAENTALTRSKRELDDYSGRVEIRANALAARVDELESQLRDQAAADAEIEALRAKIRELEGELAWKTAAINFADLRINTMLDQAKPSLLEVTNIYNGVTPSS